MIDKEGLVGALTAARDGFVAMGNNSIAVGLDTAIALTQGMPEVDPDRHGTWVRNPESGGQVVRCSNCGYAPVVGGRTILYKFCPRCGICMNSESST